ncbi:MAG: ATP-binding protein [Verrucomicrobia bacterium]|nr:ATP-binding protein [Verrucomicrobiota bacterium]
MFIDEADQTLGRRGGSGSEPEVSGRVYSMIAQEMSNRDNRGRLVWILATSRPDLVEVDLKRPGRVDLKIPLFPTTTPQEGAELLAALGRSRQLDFPAEALASIRDRIPDLLTPGEVDALLGI